jgi:hypothetical protein
LFGGLPGSDRPQGVDLTTGQLLECLHVPFRFREYIITCTNY